jgi:hypothetical protein
MVPKDGPAMDHYCCYSVYASVTLAERISDTFEFFPEQMVLLFCSLANAAVIAAKQLIIPLQHRHASSPIAPIDHGKLQALTDLAQI